uniref:Uncharacterized protein n=1 Tax=Rhizophora mucronata TaxID=61149 RepID=A0A2P2QV29_RHIMU
MQLLCGQAELSRRRRFSLVCDSELHLPREKISVGKVSCT